MVVPTTLPYPQIRLLLQLFADRQGEPINWSELRSESNISIPTIKKLAYGFEAIFLLRSLNLEGDIKGPVYYFEDIGELNSIRQRKVNQDDQIAHFIINHIRGELTYSPTGQSFRLFQYRTRAGVVVPVCLEMLNEYIGIVPIEGQTPTRSQMAAGDSFLKKYNRSKVVFTGMRCQNKVINERRVIAALGVTI
jgi:predicted AAA+ superfamily ATPase